MSDSRHMHAALELAGKGAWTCAPNPQVGCVIVRDGEVVGRGWHARAGEDHAEIVALRDAAGVARGADVYVTLEPCAHHGRTPPCVDALVAAAPARVFYALRDPHPLVDGKGAAALRGAGIEVEEGMLGGQAAWQNRGYARRVTAGKPWVTVKTASSLDGRIALPDGTSKWLTSAPAREQVHRLRAASCAIMTGSGTALADDPSLTARGVGAQRQPLRVLVDGQGQCPPSLRMLAADAVVVTAAAPHHDYGDGITHLQLPDAAGKVDLAALLVRLAQRWQVNYLMVEGGGGLVGAMLDAGLVDEIVAYVAPRVLGAGKSLAEFVPHGSLEAAPAFVLREVGQVGADCRLTLVRG